MRETGTHDIRWGEEGAVPFAVIHAGGSDPHAYHPVFGWRMKVFAYLDGFIRLFSAEKGSRFFGPASWNEGARRVGLIIDGKTIELDFARSAVGGDAGTLMLGAGYFRAEVTFANGKLVQQVILGDMMDCHVLIVFEWQPSNAGAQPPRLVFPTNAPEKPIAGRDFIRYDLDRYGSLVFRATGDALRTTDVGFTACLSQPLVVWAGYGQEMPEPPSLEQSEAARSRMRAFWQDRLKRLETSLRDEALRELRGSLVQMVGAAIWDGINDQLCATNGGLYLCNPLSSTLDQPGGFYSYRDGNQVAFAVVSTFPELARDQLIRNVTTFRHDWGIPQSSCTVAGSIGYRAPGGGHGKCAIASDQVYWFLLALSEYLRTTREFDLLQRSLANAHGETKTLRAHLDDMLRFVDDVVGYGPHGLCRFLSGDWNDYLGNIGSEGRGESFFNVALNIISKERLAWVYEAMGESVAAADLRHQAALLREKAAPYLHGQWFPRAIADDGRIVGGEEDRLYLESQPWLVLARCGSAEARRRALQSAFDHCMTPIGPVIIDRGLVAADWAGITQCRYPLGCGENAGIWWIAGYWLAMALDQEGLTDMADQVYRSCSAENHHRHFPAEWWSPFMSPDGIDGRESPTFGKAQQASGGYNRERNPHEVAKFAYQVWFASHPGRPQVLCW